MNANRDKANADSPRLIINADDFGYFPEVSSGIAHCVAQGTVTATSIIVHADTVPTVFWEAQELDRTDVGIHLNLSFGRPMTPKLQNSFASAHFAGKASTVRALVQKTVTVDDLEREWDAQIETCKSSGISPSFINSHEHLHMFPGLFQACVRLANRHHISWMRYCTPEWSLQGSAGLWLRNSVFMATSLVARRPVTPRSAILIGTAPSGRLNAQYLEKVLKRLKPGNTYELMCHPGAGVPETAGALSDYHHWDTERTLLTDPATRAMIEQHNIALTRFSEL